MFHYYVLKKHIDLQEFGWFYLTPKLNVTSKYSSQGIESMKIKLQFFVKEVTAETSEAGEKK